MPSPKYPLKPLLEHRARQVDDATAELGDAVRARASADAKRSHAEEAWREAEERADRVKLEEAERLARGELRASDLAWGEAWEIGARVQLDELARAVVVAERTVEDARGEEAVARLALGERMADRDVVAKDEMRFQERITKRTLLAEEEAGEETFQGKGGTRGP